MAREVCKGCGAICCTCTGCQPSTYFVNGLCPTCLKQQEKNATSQTN